MWLCEDKLKGKNSLLPVAVRVSKTLKSTILAVNEGVVSKETVVLRRWGSSIQKFGFINRVDKCKLATVQRF